MFTKFRISSTSKQRSTMACISLSICFITLFYQMFSGSHVQPITEKFEEKINVLLVAYGRGGSTLTYNLTKAYPLTFSFYEPFFPFLHGGSLEERPETPHNVTWSSSTAIRILQEIFQCNIKAVSFLLEGIFSHHMGMVEELSNVWPSIAKSWPFIGKLCRMSSVNVVKTIRINFDVVEKFYESFSKNNILKVIHLVRDPRGIMYSRLNQTVFRTPLSLDSNFLCKRMSRNIERFKVLQKKYPSDFIQLKYEDWAESTYEKVKDLFKFIGLNDEEFISRKFVDNITYTERFGATNYSRRFNLWKRRLDFGIRQRIENDCSKLIESLKYLKLQSK